MASPFFYVQPWFDNQIAGSWLRCVPNVFVRFGGKLRQVSEKKSKMELGSGTSGYQYPPSGSIWLLGFIINILDDLMTDCIIDLQSSWHFFGKTKEWKYHAKKVPYLRLRSQICTQEKAPFFVAGILQKYTLDV